MLDHPIFSESIRRIRELLAQRAAAVPALEAGLAGLSPVEREVLERCIHSSGDVSIALDLRFSPAAAEGRSLPEALEGPADDALFDPLGAPAAGKAQGAFASSGSTAAPQASKDTPVSAVSAGQEAGVQPGDAAVPLVERAVPDGLCGRQDSACARGLAALRAGAPILTDTAMAAAAVAPMARRTLGTTVHNLLAWAPEEVPAGSTRTAAAMQPAWRELTSAGPPPLLLVGSAPTALEALLDLVASGACLPSLVIGMPVGFVGVAESKRRLAASGLPQIRLEGSRGGAGLVAAAANALLRRAALEQQELVAGS